MAFEEEKVARRVLQDLPNSTDTTFTIGKVDVSGKLYDVECCKAAKRSRNNPAPIRRISLTSHFVVVIIEILTFPMFYTPHLKDAQRYIHGQLLFQYIESQKLRETFPDRKNLVPSKAVIYEIPYVEEGNINVAITKRVPNYLKCVDLYLVGETPLENFTRLENILCADLIQ